MLISLTLFLKNEADIFLTSTLSRALAIRVEQYDVKPRAIINYVRPAKSKVQALLRLHGSLTTRFYK